MHSQTSRNKSLRDHQHQCKSSIYLSTDSNYAVCSDATSKATNNSNNVTGSNLSHDHRSCDSYDVEGAEQLQTSPVTWQKRATAQWFNTTLWGTTRVSNSRYLENRPYFPTTTSLWGTNARLRFGMMMCSVFVFISFSNSCSQVNRQQCIQADSVWSNPLNVCYCYHPPTSTA